MRVRKFLLPCLLLYSTKLLHADELGRLFYTPEQRQQLERGAATELSSPKLNGIVQKHGSRRTIWLDEQAQFQSGHDRTDSQLLDLPGKPPKRIKVGERAS